MKVTLFGNLRYKPWNSESMNRYAKELYFGLKNELPRSRAARYPVGKVLSPVHPHSKLRDILRQNKTEVDLVEPELPFYLKFLPSKTRVELARFNYYPNLAAQYKSDIYHVTDHSYAQLIKGLDKKRCIVTCHDLIPLRYERDAYSLSKFKESVSYLSLARVILADSMATKTDLINLLGISQDKIRVVYLGRDERFKPVSQETKDSFLQRFGLSKSSFKILHIGNNLVYKNVDKLIQALKILEDKGSEFTFIKVGPLPADIGVIKSEHFVHIPYISEEQLPSLYNSVDVLASPSVHEGFGLPTLEALSCGNRVVISKDNSLEEIAQECGIYVNPNSADSIANGLERSKEFVDDKSFTQKAIKQASKFSWEKCVKEVLQIYNEVVND